MRISAWSSVVCSSDLRLLGRLAGSRGDVLRQREHHAPAGLVDKPGDDARGARLAVPEAKLREIDAAGFLHAIDEIVAGRRGAVEPVAIEVGRGAERLWAEEIGRESCRESVCQYV